MGETKTEAERTMKVYISGKVTGLGWEQAQANFDKASEEVREMGHEPLDPLALVNHKDEEDQSWQGYIKRDVKLLCDADAIYMQENWRDSNGATAEFNIAVHLELDILFQHRNSPEKKIPVNIKCGNCNGEGTDHTQICAKCGGTGEVIKH